MAYVLKSNEREFKENPNKIDYFRILSDISRAKKGIEPENLNFDLRQLNPGEYSAPYHFHRYSEEFFMILSGTATLRTSSGLEIVTEGDMMFFEKGEKGVHQLFNHSSAPCVFLDIRTFTGFDLVEYPDSNKLFITPGFKVFRKNDQVAYFDGEENIEEVWQKLRLKK